MITTLTIKQLAANKLRFLATAFAVILGVAFLAGTLILTDTIRGTLNNALSKADSGTDAYIRGTSPLTVGYGQSGGHPSEEGTYCDAEAAWQYLTVTRKF